jgi:hypothetical protein
LLWKHSFSLEPRTFPELQSRKPGQIHQRGIDLPYQLVQVGERSYYFFPPGSAILSMPYVAVANAMGISAIDQNGIYQERGEVRIQKRLAALLMAGLSVIVFLTSRLILSFGWSLLITAATAFGTQIWSTASRAMWTQTWGIFILGFVIWLILRTETKQARLRPVLLATCLSWLYFVRLTFSGSIVAIALYVLIYHRAIFLPFLMTGCVWLAAFIGYSEYHFGRLLPPYYQADRLCFTNSFWEAFPGNLISPSRGLFIYVPVLAFLAYLLVRYRRSCRPRLVVMAVGVVLIHLVAISLVLPWNGGHCYGPRLSTDLVPWFALLGMLAVEARLRWRENNPAQDSLFRVRTEWSFAMLLLVCSVTLNGIGAISLDAWRWNALPTNVDQDSSRVWDWRHPQFLGVPRDSAGRAHEPAAEYRLRPARRELHGDRGSIPGRRAVGSAALRSKVRRAAFSGASSVTAWPWPVRTRNQIRRRRRSRMTGLV